MERLTEIPNRQVLFIDPNQEKGRKWSGNALAGFQDTAFSSSVPPERGLAVGSMQKRSSIGWKQIFVYKA